MWRDRVLANLPKGLAIVSAVALAAAAILYAPIVTGPSQGTRMEIRTTLILGVLVVSAASTSLIAARGHDFVRVVASLSNGFNLVWIFSFVGPPVVIAALMGIAAAVTVRPRRLVLLFLPICGAVLGALMLRLTEPPGERLFG